MKKILKRNQVIIAALAIMIVVAGYLNLSGDPMENAVSGPGKDISGTPTAEQTGTTGDIFTVADDGEIPTKPAEDTATDDAAIGDTDSEDAEKVDASADTGEEITDGKELASKDGENNDTPGAAVLASTQLSADFFSGAKLSREQIRAQNKETLMGIVNDKSISEELKQDAVAALVAMTENAELEDVTESLLEAKGFADVVVHIENSSVDVILNAASLTEAQTAQIEDIVMRKTGIDAEGIVITHAVMED